MNCAPVSHLAWMPLLLIPVVLAQWLMTAYRWKRRIALQRFLVASGVVLVAIWGVLLFAKTPSMTVQVPLPASGAGRDCSSVPTTASLQEDWPVAAIALLFAALLNWAILVLVRRMLERRAA